MPYTYPVAWHPTTVACGAVWRKATRKSLTSVAGALLSVAIAATIGGCGIGSSDAGKMTVVTGFYPLTYITKSVGGTLASVSDLAPPNIDPQNMHLNNAQRNHVAEADLVIYLKGFQPELDQAVLNFNHDRGFNVVASEPLRHGKVPTGAGQALSADATGQDPYAWLDPIRFANMVDAVAKRFGSIHPERSKQYSRNAGKLRARLQLLDQDYRNGLQNCRSRTFVTARNTFGYLADRYQLNQIPIGDLDGAHKPSHARIGEVVQLAQKDKATTVFAEPTVGASRTTSTGASDAVASVAQQLRAKTATLDPLEKSPTGEGQQRDYFTQMRANLEALRTALGCS